MRSRRRAEVPLSLRSRLSCPRRRSLEPGTWTPESALSLECRVWPEARPPILTCTQGEFSSDGHVPVELRMGSFLLLLVTEREREKPGLTKPGGGQEHPTRCSGKCGGNHSPRREDKSQYAGRGQGRA